MKISKFFYLIPILISIAIFILFFINAQDSPFDKFEIQKIYPTKEGYEWYVNMADPLDDSFVRNFSEINLIQLEDGSWQVSDEQVRFNVFSKSHQKWKNVEITGYVKLEETNGWIEVYARSGLHSDSVPCEGSSYKGKFLNDGTIEWVKEVTHPAYTSRITEMAKNPEDRESKWFGMKVVIYNYVENESEFVRLEMYEDKNVTSFDGNLKIGNNWELISVIEDKGDWSAVNDPDFLETCPPLSYNNPGKYRKADEILSMPGGNETHNLVAWRSDGQIWDFKYLSVREIVVP